MALPLSIDLTVAGHLVRHRLQEEAPRAPPVLMLELTHACNLQCEDCGRIREYADTQGTCLTRAQAYSAMVAANTPVVSISGGEPTLHPEAPAIAADALALGKVVYFCTNGLLLA